MNPSSGSGPPPSPALDPTSRRPRAVPRRDGRKPRSARVSIAFTLASAVAAAELTLALARDPAAPAGSNFPQELATTSQSGQFIVDGPRVPGLSPPREFQPGIAPRTLTPQTLAVACERIKTESLAALALPDVWRNTGSRIHVSIESRQPTNAPIRIDASPFEASWKFFVRVPSSLSEERLTRAIVQAVLLDLGNRNGNQRAAEPPLWLVEGVTQTVLGNSIEGTLPAPGTRTSIQVRREDTLARVRAQFARSEPPTFNELGQPDVEQMKDRDWARFSAGAHLCFHELRRLPNGEARIRDWLLRLQDFWNWQTGFVETFHPLFRSLLDTEKWWAITLANFTGRDAAQAWPADFALRKLDEALQPVGLLPNAGNRARRIPVEEILLEWDFPRQLPVLRQLLQRLHALRINAPPDLRSLVLRYLDTIDEYVDGRSRVGLPQIVRGQPSANPRQLLRGTVQRLRELDAERSRAARPEPPPDTPPSAA